MAAWAIIFYSFFHFSNLYLLYCSINQLGLCDLLPQLILPYLTKISDSFQLASSDIVFGEMSPKAKFYSFMLVAIFLFSVPVQDVSAGCYGALRCSYAETASSMETQSRKVLGILKSRGMHAPTLTEDGKELMARELRAVPSGPDPLHHNGGTPKKPRTP